MGRTPKRRQAKRALARLAHDAHNNNRHETHRFRNRSVKATFLCLPVLGVLLIHQGDVHVQVPPEATYAAASAFITVAAKLLHLRRRRQ